MTVGQGDLMATLEAERAIHHTFFRFFRLMDTFGYDEVGSCFTADAEIDYAVMPDTRQVFQGRDVFTAFVLENTKPRIQKVAHVAGQTLIAWEDGRPRLKAYATAWHWFTANADQGDLRPADWAVVGYMEDDYEQVDGEWLVARRVVRPVAGVVATGLPPIPVEA